MDLEVFKYSSRYLNMQSGTKVLYSLYDTGCRVFTVIDKTKGKLILINTYLIPPANKIKYFATTDKVTDLTGVPRSEINKQMILHQFKMIKLL